MPKSLIEALEKCQTVFAEYAELHRRKLKNPMNAGELSAVHRKIERNRDMSDMCLDVLSRARSADEQPVASMVICPDCNGAGGDNNTYTCGRCNGAGGVSTPPDDLVEEEARQRAVEVVAKIEMDREGYPLSRTQEEIYTDACETVNAVLQAISPHLSEREKIVAWLRQKSLDLEAHRAVRRRTGLADRYRKLADAISRGDHISGEGR